MKLTDITITPAAAPANPTIAAQASNSLLLFFHFPPLLLFLTQCFFYVSRQRG